MYEPDCHMITAASDANPTMAEMEYAISDMFGAACAKVQADFSMANPFSMEPALYIEPCMWAVACKVIQRRWVDSEGIVPNPWFGLRISIIPRRKLIDENEYPNSRAAMLKLVEGAMAIVRFDT